MGIATVWDKASKKKRPELLRSLGHHHSWSKLKFADLQKHSGGMVKRDLDKLWKIHQSGGRKK